jgi:hypothetical protein
VGRHALVVGCGLVDDLPDPSESEVPRWWAEFVRLAG